MKTTFLVIPSILAALALSGCGGAGFGQKDDPDAEGGVFTPEDARDTFDGEGPRPRQTLFQLFNRGDPEQRVSVNRYIWAASLEVLDFLPIQTIDPFTGVIVTGFGTPPGSGRAYRATVLIDDPALDARSLKVALLSRSGPVDAATVRAVEDAILTRARQLRVGDSRL